MKTHKEQHKIKPINEALENDITWGDSWAGRIFSSVFRNAKMIYDLNKAIPDLIDELEMAITRKVVEEISKDQKIAETVKDVKKAGIKEAIIENIANNPKDLERNINKLTKEHGEDKIENIINSFPEEVKEIVSALITHENEAQQVKDTKKSSYPEIVRNLKALRAIVGDDLQTDEHPTTNSPTRQPKEYKQPNDDERSHHVGHNTSSENENENENGRIIKFNDYKKKDTSNPEEDKKEDDDEEDDEALLATNEKLILDRNNTDLKLAHQKLSKAIINLKSDRDKGIGVNVNLLSVFIENSVNSNSKESLKKLYSEIYKYHSGTKTGIGKLDSLLNEGIDVLENNNKLVIIAEKIARFYQRSIQFEKLNLYASLGDLGKALKIFNESMSSILKAEEVNNREVVELPEESVKESFLSNLLQKDSSSNKIRISGFGNKVTIVYNGKDFNTFEEMDKLSKENLNDVENKVNDTKLDDAQVTQMVERSSIDVIEIVRIFNKANRLIVKNNIPSFRTNGKINTTRANNWTHLDGRGVDPNNPGAGPFRNNKLHQAWNDGVLKIIKENSTILKETKLVNSDGKMVNAKYPITKFMTDALDDNKLSFNGGYQSKYLHEYFGIKYDTKPTKPDNIYGNVDVRNDKKEDKKEETEVKPISAGGDYTWNRALGKFKKKGIYKIHLKGEANGIDINNEFYLVGIDSYEGYILYKMSKSDEIVKKYSEGYENKKSEDKISYIFFDTRSNTKNHDFNIKKRVMLSKYPHHQMSEDKVTEIELREIYDVRILKENNEAVTAYDTHLDINDDFSYTDKYNLLLKKLLIDTPTTDKRTVESIQFFKDFININK